MPPVPLTLPAAAGAPAALAADPAEETRRRLAGRFAAWGYRRIRTPLWEEARDELLAVFPETALCRFVDPAGRVLALRPDHTLAVARWAASRLDGADPWRLYYLDPVFRRDPRDGRFTAVTQAGVELLGSSAPEGDVEILGLLLEALDALAAPGTAATMEATVGAAGALEAAGPEGIPFPARVAVGHTGVLQDYLAATGLDEPAAAAALAALARRDRVALRRHLEAALGAGRAAETYRFLTGSFPLPGALQPLERLGTAPAAELATVLQAAGRYFPAAAQRLRFEPGLVRDLQYYTGLVIEVFAGWRRIAAGGRYDGLLARLGGRGPAVGVAFDLEAVAEAAGPPEGPGPDAGGLPAGRVPGALPPEQPPGSGPAAEGPVAGAIDYLVAGPAGAAAGPGGAGQEAGRPGDEAGRLWAEARRLREQGASAVVLCGAPSEEEALAAARRLGCLRLLWLDGRRRVLRMARPAAR
ncbi:ATP phosphoribosyltransferase regulatory subunit [Thermaerobacter sp. PB12/4term]|uniref:ATP phosphoribosyltransferase regulatory subunit n=1 Tax=Thermaerobacter sp. PB12/4term TaxID=2293838 RepID=UPI000E325167|nr:ATP phosphoribosyltransferase regulatory subunit [Thermaerobacter sp. PB12/4term]QIA26596.1 ATP phosphoribosyltransferase regulatory subunit [Thermaerobacter sp. PB12/4term]